MLQFHYKGMKIMKFIKWLCLGCFLIVTLFCKKQYNLENGLSSKEEVISATMNFIQKGDLKGFEGILLTRREHNDYFWPFVGERFHSDKGINADIAYDMMQNETQVRLRALINAFENKIFKIDNINCSRPVEKYGPFDLYLGCNFNVKYLDGTKIKETAINGVICTNNKCKLYHLKD